MTKVLFDPIYSAQPQFCSSASKFKRIATDLLAADPDLFIYWLVPDWMDEESKAWLPSSDRVTYHPFPYSKDRVKEYQTLYRELEDYVAFNGKLWDFDVLITMRTQQVPNIRVLMSSPRLKAMTWMKKVILLEEMAVFSFRKTVPVSHPGVQDMMTAAAYWAADRTFITANHVREDALQEARTYFGPSVVKQIATKLHLASPCLLSEFYTKDDKTKFHRGQEPLCLGFVGRMSNSMTRLPEIYDLMDKHWILKGDLGFKVLISTVSTGVKLKPPEFVVMENNPRDKFWQRLRQDMHLVISMSIDAEFAQGLVEAACFGVPLILAREEWTEGLFGADYPFFAKGEAQAYALVKAFHDDYDKHYAVFMAWRDNAFKARFAEGGIYALNLYAAVVAEVIGHGPKALQRFRDNHPTKANNGMLTLVRNQVGDRDEFVLFDIFRELDEKGELKYLADKLEDDARYKRSLVFSTPWNEFRLMLQAFFGWKDASPKVGHMRKIV